MLKIWLTRIKNNVSTLTNDKRIDTAIKFVTQHAMSVPANVKFHLKNFAIVLSAYTLVMMLIPQDQGLLSYAKGIFAIACSYCAVCIWLLDQSESSNNRIKIMTYVTACIAPLLFISSSIFSAIVSVAAIAAIEFIIISYIDGCNLFADDASAIYVICNSENDETSIAYLSSHYKVLETVVLADANSRHRLKSIEDLEKWLRKITTIPFFPTPQRLIYCADQLSSTDIKKLTTISSAFAIPVFKISAYNTDKRIHTISPVTISDLEPVAISNTDKSALSSSFKRKKIWICYNGNDVVMSFISLLADIPATEVTVWCDSEYMAIQAQNELNSAHNTNARIHIMDFTEILTLDDKPDVLFYNMPIQSANAHNDNLKAAVIKNVIDTEKMIKLACNANVSHVFMLSSSHSAKSDNWVSATQRLGELYVQLADRTSKDYKTKFNVIRLPEVISEQHGAYRHILSSITSCGHVKFDYPYDESQEVYHKTDVVQALVKIVSFAMKQSRIVSSVYIAQPQSHVTISELIETACNVLGLKNGIDIHISKETPPKNIELDNYANIAEDKVEETPISDVMFTQLSSKRKQDVGASWTAEDIKQMSTRDIISEVYQRLQVKSA